jgi:hypothetical protein
LDCNHNGYHSCGGPIATTTISSAAYPACTGILKGDYDCSGTVNQNDIAPFLNEILHGAATCLSDFNGDGKANGRDIQGFVNAM